MRPTPHSPTGRLVSMMLAVVVSFCGCTLRALAMDGDASAGTVTAPVSCCHQHVCDPIDEEPPSTPATSGCHCIHGATVLDAGHEGTLSVLAHPPVTMVPGFHPATSSVEPIVAEAVIGADPPPDGDDPEACPRSLRRIIVLQV